jgi:hypothetical protein
MAALVKKQQGEINSLKATIADLGGAFKLHVTDTANNLKMSMTSYGPWFTKCSQEAPEPSSKSPPSFATAADLGTLASRYRLRS